MEAAWFDKHKLGRPVARQNAATIKNYLFQTAGKMWQTLIQKKIKNSLQR